MVSGQGFCVITWKYKKVLLQAAFESQTYNNIKLKYKKVLLQAGFESQT